ncbi:hypothetical protein SNE40_002693 [Patella caerulea]|uniref:DDE-1 domain-containing protein n=1 Tax=Patella caerulea TaxID=87958 RepID=A0AAN8K917_PATCE
MPPNYKRKTNRGQTPKDIMERAANAVAGGQSIRSTAREFGIDRMTLKRYTERQDEDRQLGYTPMALCHKVFTPNMETDLANHVKHLADMFHGLSMNRCDKKAGLDWWLGFKKRQNFAIRSPEATSLGRAVAFNRPVVDEFFNNLKAVMDKYKCSPRDIYNTDETGCTTVQNAGSVVTEKGKKQVGAITSAERGELVTVAYIVNAIGSIVPPLFIFLRVHYKEHSIRGGGGATECIGAATRSDWMNEDTFVEYLNDVVKHTKCSPENKILLILDNNDTHISLRAVDLARSHGMVLLTIPPHTPHCSVYGPFKTAYNRAMDAWLRSDPGKTVTIYEIPTLVNQAQMIALTPLNITAGFRATGIYPYNSDKFTETEREREMGFNVHSTQTRSFRD